MKPLDLSWRRSFVRESNEIDRQPGFKNAPGSPRWDDHLLALNLAIEGGLKQEIADPCTIHRMLMERMWPKIAGRLRTVNVVVGHRNCPSYHAVPGMLDSWMTTITTLFQSKNEEIRSESVDARTKQLWWAHVEFEKIHPFQDGNGRTGRILMVNHALLLGVEPPLVKYQDRFGYYQRFA